MLEKKNLNNSRTLSVLGFFALLSLSFFAVVTTHGQTLKSPFRTGEIIVSLAPGADINTFNELYGTTVKEHLEGTNQYLLSLPAGTKVSQKLSRLTNDERILFARPNRNIQLAEISQGSQPFLDQGSQPFLDQGSQPFLDQGSQPFLDSAVLAGHYGATGMARTRLTEAHQFTRGWGVKVAVIDTGIDAQHYLLGARIAFPQYDFVDNDTNPQEVSGGPGYGHGTFVSGLIALTAPGAKIMPIRAFGPDGYATSFSIARAIRFAADNGADVINMSFGMLERDLLIEAALIYASTRCFLVASGGNENLNQLHYPAESKANSLSVVSTDSLDRKADFSNYNDDAQTAAPGVSLYSSYPQGRWATWSGTSFSTALVSGQAALLLQLNLNLNRTQLKNLIIQSGVNIDPVNPQYAGKLGVRIDYLGAVNRFYNGN